MSSKFLLGAAGNSGGIITDNLEQYFDFGNSSCYSGNSSTNTNTTVTDLAGNYNGYLWYASNSRINSNNGGYLERKDLTGSGYSHDNNSWWTYVGLGAYDRMYLIGTNDFTFEFWHKPWFNGYSQYNGGPGTLTRPRGQGTSDSSWALNFDITSGHYNKPAELEIQYYDGNTLKSYYADSNNGTSHAGGSNNGTGGYPINNGTIGPWEHLVITRQGGVNTANNFKAYRNGQLTNANNGGVSLSKDYSQVQNNISNASWWGHNNATFATRNALFATDLYNFYRGHWAIYRAYNGKGFTQADAQHNYDQEKTRFGLS